MARHFKPSTVKAKIAKDIALEIGLRITNAHSSDDPEHKLLLDPSLGMGHAGIACLMSTLYETFGQIEWAKATHDHLSAALKMPRVQVGLFDGWTGILAAADYCSRTGSFARLTASLKPFVSNLILQNIMNLTLPPTSVADFDIMSGVAGQLLVADAKPYDQIIDYYRSLILRDNGIGLRSVTYSRTERFTGSMNLGMAHGLSGVIAALSIARVGDKQIIQEALSRLLLERVDLEGHFIWPMFTHMRPSYDRLAWCYGNLGQLNALSTALKFGISSCELQNAYADTMTFIQELFEKGTVQEWNLCHGRAGILLTLDSLVVNVSAFSERIELLFDELVDGFDSTVKFGYRTQRGAGYVDDAGLLTGATGIALTLLSVATSTDPSWARLMGIDNT